METKISSTRTSLVSRNFFTIENVKKAFPHKQLEAYEEKDLKRIPAGLARQAIKDRNDFIIFPFIPRLLPVDFLHQYNEDSTNRWIVLRRQPVDGSLNKDWSQQLLSIPDNEKCPSALVIAYGMIMMLNRDLNFFRPIGNLSFRTQTVCSIKKKRVSVKLKMYRLEPHLFTCDDHECDPRLGILTEKVF